MYTFLKMHINDDHLATLSEYSLQFNEVKNIYIFITTYYSIMGSLKKYEESQKAFSPNSHFTSEKTESKEDEMNCRKSQWWLESKL